MKTRRTFSFGNLVLVGKLGSQHYGDLLLDNPCPSPRARDKVRLSPTIVTQNINPFVLWVALQLKSFIPIFSLFQPQDLKDNTLYKRVSKREDTQIWVMTLLISKVGLLYGYSVGGYGYCVGNPFWVWVAKWVWCRRQPKRPKECGEGKSVQPSSFPRNL